MWLLIKLLAPTTARNGRTDESATVGFLKQPIIFLTARLLASLWFVLAQATLDSWGLASVRVLCVVQLERCSEHLLEVKRSIVHLLCLQIANEVGLQLILHLLLILCVKKAVELHKHPHRMRLLDIQALQPLVEPLELMLILLPFHFRALRLLLYQFRHIDFSSVFIGFGLGHFFPYFQYHSDQIIVR